MKEPELEAKAVGLGDTEEMKWWSVGVALGLPRGV